MESILQELHIAPMVGTIVYSLLGFVVFYVGFVLFDKFTPFSIRKEIEQDQNDKTQRISKKDLFLNQNLKASE